MKIVNKMFQWLHVVGNGVLLLLFSYKTKWLHSFEGGEDVVEVVWVVQIGAAKRRKISESLLPSGWDQMGIS